LASAPARLAAHVQLVRELVDHQVVAALQPRSVAHHVRPGQHHGAALHGLADQRLGPAVHHAGLVDRLARRQHLVRVHDDADEVLVPVQRGLAPVQQGQAGLRRNVDGHGIGHFQAMGAVELFLVQEQGAERAQLALLGQRQAGQEGVALQGLQPKLCRNVGHGGHGGTHTAPEPVEKRGHGGLDRGLPWTSP